MIIEPSELSYLAVRNEKQVSEAEKSLSEPGGTKLYLAYGSNLAASTFLGRRGIKPLRAINVVAPDLQLVFDLPGIPYVEPCFANSRVRHPPDADADADADADPYADSGLYSQLGLPPAITASSKLLQDVKFGISATDLGWHKGLVGVAYEVTDADFAHIIATEGGGASYLDVKVDAFPLERGSKTVPAKPKGLPIIVHTLFAPPESNRVPVRRDGWAEPSPRYLGLLTTGAAENDLPLEYRDWLQTLKPYRPTTVRQRIGKGLFISTFVVPGLALLGLQSQLADKNGNTPKWLGKLITKFFEMIWTTYDTAFLRLYGEGERTIGDPYPA